MDALSAQLALAFTSVKEEPIDDPPKSDGELDPQGEAQQESAKSTGKKPVRIWTRRESWIHVEVLSILVHI